LYKNALEATEQSLRMQALGITVTLNSFIQNLSIQQLKIEGKSIMSEMLLDDRWEGIAFLALYDEKGEVILHSNPLLIGKKTDDIADILTYSSPYYHKITLGTGEEVFVSDTKIKKSGSPYILRVALHTYPAELLLRTTRTHLIFIFLSALLIVFFGIFALLIMHKIEKMQIKMKELENLSILSKVLAHEIRNPLGSIKGFTQYLLKKTEDKSIKDYLNVILKESLRLERLSNELSSYANPHKNLKIDEFNLKELIEETLLPFIEQNDLIIERDLENLKVKTDRDKLKQILTNIIQNAVDAVGSSNQKRITIKARKISGKIKIEIADTGIGMSEETLKRATEAFFTTKPRGTGLGLAIVSKLCESLRIGLKISSKTEEGTKVCLTMPESL
jgi:two-component system sensor histidine kinase HydH